MCNNSKQSIAIVRDLAKKLKEISEMPEQEERRQLWKKINRLEKCRPPVVCSPGGACWGELIPESTMETTDPFQREIEMYLRQQLFCACLNDDHVIEPGIYVHAAYQGLDWATMWGVEIKKKASDMCGGAWQYDPPLKELSDIDKLVKPHFELDRKATAAKLEKAQELVGGILDIGMVYGIFNGPYFDHYGTSIDDAAAFLRGLEPLMMDIYDHPEWLHRLMQFITDAYLEDQDRVASKNRLVLNSNNTFCYTDELPAKDFDGVHVRFKDLWCSAEGQEFDAVSPSLTEEFLLPYQKQIINKFGLSTYGCCERLTDKFDIITRHFTNLRRIRISAWTDLRKAVEKLGDRYVLSWRPNPAEVSLMFSEENVRKTIREGMEIAGDCHVEVSLSHIETVGGNPEILHKWTRIAKEVVDDY